MRRGREEDSELAYISKRQSRVVILFVIYLYYSEAVDTYASFDTTAQHHSPLPWSTYTDSRTGSGWHLEEEEAGHTAEAEEAVGKAAGRTADADAADAAADEAA